MGYSFGAELTFPREPATTNALINFAGHLFNLGMVGVATLIMICCGTTEEADDDA